jgi:hypothetical protein
MAVEDKAMGELELNDTVSLGDVVGEFRGAPPVRTLGAQEAG